MKISEVKTTIVTVPFSRPEIWARGARPCITNVILELITDEGIIGLGETGGGERSASILESMRSYLVGLDPFDIELVRLKYGRNSPTYAAVEMALLDIQGKVFDKPLYKLLGGAVRRNVPYMYYLLRDDPKVMAKEVLRAFEDGFETIYIKVGVDLKDDLEAIRVIRETIGFEPRLRIDPNETWTVGTTISLGSKLQKFNLELLEDPIPHFDIGGMRRLRSSLDIPIAAQESCVTQSNIFHILSNEAADIILVDQHRNGGLKGMIKCASMVEAAGMPVYKHSGGELGISSSAALHTLSTIRNNLHANQTYYQFLEDDVVKESIPIFRDGCLKVPDRPGLGVTLDRKKLAHYHEVYLRKEVIDGSYQPNNIKQEVSEEWYYYPRF